MPRTFLVGPADSDEDVLKKVDCSLVLQLPNSERCYFVKNAASCQGHMGLVSYMDLIYCKINPKNEWSEKAVIPGIIVLLLFCFYVLGTSADVRLCPALQMLSKLLKMSEVLAGVTLVAFGNGAPDFFSCLFSFNDPDRHVYSDVYASTILCTSVIPGLIIIFSPFQVHASSMLRDSGFILLGVVLLNFNIRNLEMIKFPAAFSFIILYALYIILVFLEQYLLLKEVAANRSSENDQLDLKRRVTTARRPTFLPRLAGMTPTGKNEGIWKQCLTSLIPFGKDDWDDSNKCARVVLLIKAPILLVLNICIPIADFEVERRGWSKLLNSFQLVFMPITIFLLLETEYKYYLILGTVILTLPFAIFVMITSRVDTPPKYHWIFAIYSAVGSTTAISLTAQEICELIYCFGLIVGISSSFLGATVLAWGNSIGDIVANLMLARQGFNEMGFAASFGAPIFNLFFTLGVTLSFLSYESGQFAIDKGVFGETCNTFLIIHSIITILWMTVLDFNARRMIGVLCIFMYIFFFTFAILTELHIIDSYKTVVTSTYL